MTLSPGQTFLHFRLVEQIGEGGMGVVWKATDTSLGRSVAIKFLSESFREDADRIVRFKREARLLASINHTNIAAIHGLHEAEGIGFLSMELIPGMNLAQRLSAGALPVPEALAICAQILDALEATHSAGLIHRDLKPANIAITPKGQVKILDFGLARSLVGPVDVTVEPTVSVDATRHGQIVGTLAYMSPEQARGSALDERSDIWAFGCVLYEALSGRPAFTGVSASDLIAAVLKDEPDWTKLPGATPPGVIALLKRCLSKDSAQRPNSIGEIREALASSTGAVPEAGSLAAPASRSSGKSIAVLPFANMSSDPEQDYFCEGIAEELIHGLGRIIGLRVASRTSAFQFRGSGHDFREVGERLNVETFLEGGVRKSGNRLRITTQLVSVADGYRLWSERYDRTLEDIFAIQDEIAENIIQRLEIELAPAKRQVMNPNAAGNVAAYDFYLRGRKFFHRWDRRGFETAIEMFERAGELDPLYARAYSGVAESCSMLYLYMGADAITRDRADTASRKALELGPDLSETHAARGLVLSALLGQPEAAIQLFERAIELDPQLYETYYFYARSKASQGEFERAARLYECAMELRPDDYQVALLLPQVYRSLGRHAEADTTMRRGLELARHHLSLFPEDVRALVLAASGFVVTGDPDTGLAWAQRALALAPRETMVLYNVASAYAVAGHADEALSYLDSAVTEGFRERAWIETDSEFDSLHGLPRYREILERISRLAAATPGATE